MELKKRDEHEKNGLEIGQNWLGVILAIIVLVLVILLIYERLGRWPDWTGFGTKTFWDLMQLLIIPVVLAVGAYLLNESVRQREIKRNRNIALNELRKNLLAKLTRAYFKVKKARRILKGNIVTTVIPMTTVTKNNVSPSEEDKNKESENKISKSIPYKEYETQIKEIIDAQLEFEFYHYQLEVIPYIFSGKTSQELKDLTRQIEKNLNSIIKEYEELDKNNNKYNINTDQLKKLDELITTETFKCKFAKYFHRCFELIDGEILSI